ncbi:aminotransferase class I/II-fold pyridoxal phosphate-dependent enzyme [Streptomyces sp. NPDC008121]|uniref:aminotransferase class I/II-fold pyridoxal phosphate-dependent enzyme n=1 Tax=Streptomyces sp. NPDC008121 TaxID=3364809 RepID=UPI0036EAD9F6
MPPEPARRPASTDDYLFSFVDRERELAERTGHPPVPLGVGDCDLPTPPHIVEAMRRAARDPARHRQPPCRGARLLREAASGFLSRRFGVAADPDSEVQVTLGSREAMAHLALAYLDWDDVVLVPDPAYPVYATWARFCGAEVVRVPLREGHGFLPDLDAIPADTARRAKLFWICYPNNPTGAVAPRAFFDELARFALRHDILVASDAAYSEIYYDTAPPPSFLGSPGAMECGIEFHSLSPAYRMPGRRVGFVAGNPHAVGALRAVKKHAEAGRLGTVQHAAVTALTDTTGYPDRLRDVYRARMNLLCDGLEAAGLEVLRPRAAVYALVRTPGGASSEWFSEELLHRAGVSTIPGTAFGPGGEGFVRLTVCASTEQLTEAVQRIAAARLAG